MAVAANLLIAKAKATIDSISKMTAKEKGEKPFAAFCDDFNGLRKLTAENFPALVDVLPKELDVFDTGYGYRACNVHFKEIEAYYRQIVNLLQAVGEVP